MTRVFFASPAEPPVSRQKLYLLMATVTTRIRAFGARVEVFKWAVLLLAVLYLAVFWQSTQNGRYVLHDDRMIILDTRTGHVARLNLYKAPAIQPQPIFGGGNQ